jgi:hypothetical protein
MDIKEKTRQALEDGKIIGDGHTIFTPAFYSPYFSEYELVEAGLMTTLNSDYSSGKTTIFDPHTGDPVESVTGIYNLSFLYWLAGQLGVSDYRECFGRGSQARAIVDAIRQALS